MVTCQSRFDKKASKVDENALKELDQIVASAIRYNIHLNLTTFTLPGRTVVNLSPKPLIYQGFRAFFLC